MNLELVAGVLLIEEFLLAADPQRQDQHEEQPQAAVRWRYASSGWHDWLSTPLIHEGEVPESTLQPQEALRVGYR